ncbi:unnamed protein product [marine sediment metagenome]|uniref:Uncharacterized protein n=1 Tax=marine sediment metagenome TaxID=412755 RepID=X1IER0_9ZZZZ
MSISGISKKELEELKKLNESRTITAWQELFYADGNALIESDAGFLHWVFINLFKLIAAYEFKVKELEAVKKENEGLREAATYLSSSSFFASHHSCCAFL